MTFEEYKEKAKNEYITININDFANACAKVAVKWMKKDNPEIMLLITMISSDIMSELFEKDKKDGVVCDK